MQKDAGSSLIYSRRKLKSTSMCSSWDWSALEHVHSIENNTAIKQIHSMWQTDDQNIHHFSPLSMHALCSVTLQRLSARDGVCLAPPSQVTQFGEQNTEKVARCLL